MSFVFDIAALSRPIAGETACGDQFLVLQRPTSVVVALVDGLGHGPEAQAAALCAIETVRANAEATPRELLELCHVALRGTRGAAAAFMRFDREGQVAHAAIGNVEVCARTSTPFRGIALPGVVGLRMRKVTESVQRLEGPALFVLFTDGISSRLELPPVADLPPERAARALLDRYGKERDDAALIIIQAHPGARPLAKHRPPEA